MTAHNTGNRESDYGPLQTGDRVLVSAPGRRNGTAADRANGCHGVIVSAGPKNVVIELDEGRRIRASRNLALKNNSGLKS